MKKFNKLVCTLLTIVLSAGAVAAPVNATSESPVPSAEPSFSSSPDAEPSAEPTGTESPVASEETEAAEEPYETNEPADTPAFTGPDSYTIHVGEDFNLNPDDYTVTGPDETDQIYRAAVVSVDTPEGGSYVFDPENYAYGEEVFTPTADDAGLTYTIHYQAQQSTDNGTNWEDIDDLISAVNLTVAEPAVISGPQEKQAIIDEDYYFLSDDLQITGNQSNGEIYQIYVKDVISPDSGSYEYLDGDESFMPEADDEGLTYQIIYGARYSKDDGATWTEEQGTEYTVNVTCTYEPEASATPSIPVIRRVIGAGNVQTLSITSSLGPSGSSTLSGKSNSYSLLCTVNSLQANETFSVEIHIPKNTYIQRVDSNTNFGDVNEQESRSFEETAAEYIQTYNFKSSNGGSMSVTIPFNYSSYNGTTPNLASSTVTAVVKSSSGQILKQTEYQTIYTSSVELTAYGITLSPGGYMDSQLNPYASYTSSEFDTNNKLITNCSTVKLYLKYIRSNEFSSYGARYISSYKMTVRLPQGVEYANGCESGAACSYNSSTRVVTVTFTNGHSVSGAPYNLTPYFKVRFPGAAENQIFEGLEVSLEGIIDNKAANETNPTCSLTKNVQVRKIDPTITYRVYRRFRYWIKSSNSSAYRSSTDSEIEPYENYDMADNSSNGLVYKFEDNATDRAQPFKYKYSTKYGITSDYTGTDHVKVYNWSYEIPNSESGKDPLIELTGITFIYQNYSHASLHGTFQIVGHKADGTDEVIRAFSPEDGEAAVDDDLSRYPNNSNKHPEWYKKIVISKDQVNLDNYTSFTISPADANSYLEFDKEVDSSLETMFVTLDAKLKNPETPIFADETTNDRTKYLQYDVINNYGDIILEDGSTLEIVDTEVTQCTAHNNQVAYRKRGLRFTPHVNFSGGYLYQGNTRELTVTPDIYNLQNYNLGNCTMEVILPKGAELDTTAGFSVQNLSGTDDKLPYFTENGRQYVLDNIQTSVDSEGRTHIIIPYGVIDNTNGTLNEDELTYEDLPGIKMTIRINNQSLKNLQANPIKTVFHTQYKGDAGKTVFYYYVPNESYALYHRAQATNLENTAQNDEATEVTVAKDQKFYLNYHFVNYTQNAITSSSGLTIVDILPYTGDQRGPNDTSGNATSSQFSLDLVSANSSDFDVYITESVPANGNDVNFVNTADWISYSQASGTQKENATAVKFVLKSDKTIPARRNYNLQLPVKVPASETAAYGAEAYNTFIAYYNLGESEQIVSNQVKIVLKSHTLNIQTYIDNDNSKSFTTGDTFPVSSFSFRDTITYLPVSENSYKQQNWALHPVSGLVTTYLLAGTYELEWPTQYYSSTYEQVPYNAGGSDLLTDGSYKTNPFTLDEDHQTQTIYIGYRLKPEKTVSGRLYLDNDNSGTYNSGDTAYQGQTIELHKADGTLVSSGTTDADGNYSITLNGSEYNGSYYITAPDLTSETVEMRPYAEGICDIITGTFDSVIFEYTEEHSQQTINIVYRPLPQVTVKGTVFYDEDDDGTYSSGDRLARNVKIIVHKADGTKVKTGSTDSQGNYSITFQGEGSYYVEAINHQENNQYGLIDYSPGICDFHENRLTDTFVLNYDHLTETKNAAYHKLPERHVTGRLYVDTDGSGTYSDGDDILSRKTVYVYLSTDTETYFSAESKTDGTYDVTVYGISGTYYVKAPAIDNLVFIPYSEGNSDILDGGDVSPNFTLSDSAPDHVINIGYKAGSDTYLLRYDLNGGSYREGRYYNPTAYTFTDSFKIQDSNYSGSNHYRYSNDFQKPYNWFTGWNTAADGSGTSYAPGTTVSNLSNNTAGVVITLYAQWEPVSTYTVHYEKNDGNATGTMEDQIFSKDEVKNLLPNQFALTGRTFEHWNTSPYGGGTDYTDGQSVCNVWNGMYGILSNASNRNEKNPVIKLYAMWMYSFVLQKGDFNEAISQGISDGTVENFNHLYSGQMIGMERKNNGTDTELPSDYQPVNPLPGAEFDIHYKNADGSKGALIQHVVIGADGCADLSLTNGEYYLTETKAPEGYDLPFGSYIISAQGSSANGSSIIDVSYTNPDITPAAVLWSNESGSTSNIAFNNYPDVDLTITNTIENTNTEFSGYTGFDEVTYTVEFKTSGEAPDIWHTITVESVPIDGRSIALEGGTLSSVSGVTAPADQTLVTDADGKISFTLKNGQTFKLKDVPVKSVVTITQTQVPEGASELQTQVDNEGFQNNTTSAVTVSPDTDNQDHQVDFKLQGSYSPTPTGINSNRDNTQRILLLSAVLIGMLAVLKQIRNRLMHV